MHLCLDDAAVDLGGGGILTTGARRGFFDLSGWRSSSPSVELARDDWARKDRSMVRSAASSSSRCAALRSSAWVSLCGVSTTSHTTVNRTIANQRPANHKPHDCQPHDCQPNTDTLNTHTLQMLFTYIRCNECLGVLASAVGLGDDRLQN